MRKPYRVGHITKEELRESVDISVSGCWEWKYALAGGGYGTVRRHGRVWPAHRISYFIFKRNAPLRVIDDPNQVTTVISHRCDNRRCINPDHLRLGTQSTNMKERWERTGLRKQI